METILRTALDLILSLNAELLNIMGTTARMSFSSSVIALLIGVPIGLLLGAGRFYGKGALVVLNRTLMGMPPVVCGLIFYILFSGVGPFRHLHMLFTIRLMILAQVFIITPIVVGNTESFVSGIAGPVRETTAGLGLKRTKTYLLLANECMYQIFSTYLLAFARAIAEVGAVSMVGGAIAWKTNVMTTAIMQYTNRGNFALGIALGLILLCTSLIINVVVSLVQRRVSQ